MAAAELIYLDEQVLLPIHHRQVCITCHWFRHHAGVNCIPLLTCQLHEGLISHGDHLTHRCPRPDPGQLRAAAHRHRRWCAGDGHGDGDGDGSGWSETELNP